MIARGCRASWKLASTDLPRSDGGVSPLSPLSALLLLLVAGVCACTTGTRRIGGVVLGSLLFYGLATSWLVAAGIVGLFSGVFWLSELAQRRRSLKTALLVGGLVLCVGVLVLCKYVDFLRTTAALLLGQAPPMGGVARGAEPAFAVPLGISFFTFELIHYLVERHRGQLVLSPQWRARWLDLLAFGLFFPTLLAGPIKRHASFVAHPISRAEVAYALSRMLLGLGKKILLADTAATLAMRLAMPDQVTPLGLWMAMYAYAAQIYFDFSGYSDVAIGAARLLGYRVPENFDWPYLAHSLPDFWRRWHVSLGTWIRDYLYIPLGGSRRGTLRTALHLIVVMTICGLWHGPAWHFVVWGTYHGVFLALSNLVPLRVPSQGHVVQRWLARLLTFHVVCFGWVLFAAPSLPVALLALRRMWHLPT